MSECCCQKECLPTPTYSKIACASSSSVIRELLKLANKPEVISFAGGLPSPEGFPTAEILAATNAVMATIPTRALQYSCTEGEIELRKLIADRETQQGVPTSPEEVQIVSGSQQALDLLARVFIDPGSKILVESPTYLGALQAFNLCEPVCHELPSDEQGLNPALIGEECRGARYAYVMPTFQNPTGRTLNEERRRTLCEKAREYDFWLIEDDPYGELWYHNQPAKSLRHWAPERTIRLGTMSKILAPGFRLGYIVGPRHVIDVFTRMKQAVDLHTSSFTQHITAQVFNDGLLTTHLPKVRAIYKRQAEAMLQALEDYLPKHPEISWTHPEGGMFIWLNLPKGVDGAELMKEALKQDHPVAFVPGSAFYANTPELNHARLSFVTVSPERIRQGVDSIAKALKKFL